MSLRGIFLTSTDPAATATFYKNVAGLALEEVGSESKYRYWKVDDGHVQLAIHDAAAFADCISGSRGVERHASLLPDHGSASVPRTRALPRARTVRGRPSGRDAGRSRRAKSSLWDCVSVCYLVCTSTVKTRRAGLSAGRNFPGGRSARTLQIQKRHRRPDGSSRRLEHSAHTGSLPG
jgi:hypothetical protein